MKKLIMLGLTGLLLFGASASGSWFLFHNVEPDPETPEVETTATSQPLAQDVTNENRQLAFKPEDISVSTLIRLVGSIKVREKALDERQETVGKKEQQVDLVLSDLKRERLEIADLDASISGKIEQVKQLVQQLELNEPQATSSEIDESNNSPQENGYDEKQIKRLAEWLQGMELEDAGGTIKEFMNDGKIDLVALVMVEVQDRDAPKILGALEDQKLITRIAEAMLNTKTKN